ncbi:hypothetical protein SKAU_G00418670 [Synaphobranchus kaupii]|uniref:Immunoglobulin V-set domain-containing protein n=1 Tax=Synaphobranchus kaupii TaxID=118154 RepID=A0A9Q1IAX1_SYNKA|nr:hypothetical protein SKAU_G00418670 [Synaphobranchus kaupii]
MTGTERFILIGCLLQGALSEEWPIRMPQRIEAVAGSCVLIPCTFDIPSKYDKNLTVIRPHVSMSPSLSTQTHVNHREGGGDGGDLCEFELLCCSPLSQTPPKSHMDPQTE